MAILVRRSNLLVPANDASAVANAWRHNADAITLDLENAPASARSLIKSSIVPVAKGAAEVFVRVNKTTLKEDLDASVWPGLRGIVLPQVESAMEVAQAAELITTLENQRGIAKDSLCLILLLESARAVWDIRAILRASPRVSQAGLDEPDLATSLGITPDPEYDPFVYARGRLVVEATAAKIAPIGVTYPLSVQCNEPSHAEIHATSTTARNSGMKGVLCPHASWVAPVNEAYTPTAELVTWNKRVREAFAVGVAAGTAAVPLDGKMIDVPVDEWAIVVLATAEACAARDAEKQRALSRS